MRFSQHDYRRDQWELRLAVFAAYDSLLRMCKEESIKAAAGHLSDAAMKLSNSFDGDQMEMEIHAFRIARRARKVQQEGSAAMPALREFIDKECGL
jgi:hypothetical protein